jgi:hypothetical protein
MLGICGFSFYIGRGKIAESNKLLSTLALCLWNTPQPACNAALAQMQKSSCPQSLLVDDE